MKKLNKKSPARRKSRFSLRRSPELPAFTGGGSDAYRAEKTWDIYVDGAITDFRVVLGKHGYTMIDVQNRMTTCWNLGVTPRRLVETRWGFDGGLRDADRIVQVPA